MTILNPKLHVHICVPSSQLIRPLCQFRICIVRLVLAWTVSQNFAFYTCPCVRSWYLGLGTEGSRCGSHFINSVFGSLVPIRQTVTKKQLFCDLKLQKDIFSTISGGTSGLSIGNSMICSDICSLRSRRLAPATQAMIFGINTTSDISKLLYIISRAVRRVKFETILKYHR